MYGTTAWRSTVLPATRWGGRCCAARSRGGGGPGTGLGWTPRPADAPWSGTITFAAEHEHDGQLIAHGGGRFAVVEEGVHQELAVPKTQQAELDHLLEMRDLARALIEAESVSANDSPNWLALRDQLHQRSRGYVVACHDDGTGVAGLLPGPWDHLGCQPWDHPTRPVGGLVGSRRRCHRRHCVRRGIDQFSLDPPTL